jgi:N-acetylmuramoyl-L-alanine amidase
MLLLIIAAGVSLLLLGVPELHTYALQRQAASASASQNQQTILDLMLKQTNRLTSAEQGTILKKQLRLELPNQVKGEDVTITNDYLNQMVEIIIPGTGQSYFYDYPLIGRSDHIVNITYDVEQAKGIVDITLDSVYELDVSVEGRYIYIDFVDPHQIYDSIIVVDAGHGGDDVGAAKQGIQEKDINLAIVQEIKALFDGDEENIGVYYTRLDDTEPTLESRVSLANMLEADLFLSVHNNSTASGRMSTINGTEVMYRVTDTSNLSKEFAQTCLDSLLWNLGSESKGLVPGDEIYIIRTSEVPVALVEVGFMTNQEELDLLNTEAYQQKSAQALYDAMKNMLEVLHE